MRGRESILAIENIKSLELDHGSGRILPSSLLGKAINYTLTLWSSLKRYADPGNGEVRIDNNPEENAIRPSAMGKKNCHFISHPSAGQRSALIYTIIEECRLDQVDPLAFLVDVMPRIMEYSSHTITELLQRQVAETRRADRPDGLIETLTRLQR